MAVVVVRRPRLDEQGRINALVQAVVDETYGGQWAPVPLPISHEDWTLGWAALDGDTPVGIVLATGDFIDDLWIASEARNRGVGAALLAKVEAEIAERGHSIARLRVVATNLRAIAFYAREGWQIARRYPHERVSIEMVELTKFLGERANAR